MDKDPFKEYIKESEPDKRDKGYGIIEPVPGHGKGKYRFRQQG